MGQVQAAEKLRRKWAASDAARDAKIPMPTGVRVLTDIPYTASETEEEAVWHRTDIYYPEEERTLYPVIVSVHGGGWFYGDKELYSRYTKHLASLGFAVVNFNYRLAPEHKYPCGFLDVCALMSFVEEHAENYRFDRNRLFMVGDSAGAQLVSQYAIYATNPEYRALFPEANAMQAPIPTKVALNCGVYEISERGGDSISQWYLPEKLSASHKKSTVGVLDYITSAFPPAFLMVSVNDGLTPATRTIREKLEERGVPYIYREYGQNKPLDGHVFHINIIGEEAKRCNGDEIVFFLE